LAVRGPKAGVRDYGAGPLYPREAEDEEVPPGVQSCGGDPEDPVPGSRREEIEQHLRTTLPSLRVQGVRSERHWIADRRSAEVLQVFDEVIEDGPRHLAEGAE